MNKMQRTITDPSILRIKNIPYAKLKENQKTNQRNKLKRSLSISTSTSNSSSSIKSQKNQTKTNPNSFINKKRKRGSTLKEIESIPEEDQEESYYDFIYNTPKSKIHIPSAYHIPKPNKEIDSNLDLPLAFPNSIVQLKQQVQSIPCLNNNKIKPSSASNSVILNQFENELKNDPKYVTEISNDIFNYLLSVQKINQPNYHILKSKLTQYNTNNIPQYLTKHKRYIMVNDLVLLHQKFSLSDRTLFLTINLLDRSLSLPSVFIQNDPQFLLLSLTCMLISSKFEEIYYPDLTDFLYVSNNLFTKSAIIAMEEKILNEINYDILSVNPIDLLNRYYLLSGMNDDEVFFTAKYLMELTLLKIEFYEYDLNVRVCSCFYLARKIYRVKEPWGEEMVKSSGIKEGDIKKCARDVCMLLNCVSGVDVNNVREKYSKKEYLGVAVMKE